MEEITALLLTDRSTPITQKLVLGMLKNFKEGKLNLELPSGQKIVIGNGNGHHADLKIHNTEFFQKCVLNGDIGFAESYMDGDWSTSDLTLLLRWAISNVENSGIMSGSKTKAITVNLLSKINRLGHLLNKNSKEGSRKNITYHYDLSNEFYKLMLDESMSYSCAVFENSEDSLYEAQQNKYKNICRDLDIKKGDHILEIGCGWAGFIDYATTYYDCTITAVTISDQQFEYALDLIEKKKLENRVKLLKMDYRDLNGKFDKVVSIEMIEAVGHEFLPEYFQKIDSLLKKDGVAVIQAITALDSRYETYRKGVDFIQKHIFPGGHLPSLRAMTNACEKTELNLFKVRDIGLDYARTLNEWYQRFLISSDEILKLGFDEVFMRKWEYYLCYCEAAFLERNISDVHVTFVKPNNTRYTNHGV